MAVPFKPVFILIFIHALLLNLSAQKQVLLHIDSRGQQEAIPLDSNEDVNTIIEKMEMKDDISRIGGVVDTIRYNRDFTSNFGFGSLDVAFQWYSVPAELIIRELWWRNLNKTGSSHKAAIGLWRANSRLFDLPNTACNASGRIGYYKSDCDSCEYSITPFKPHPEAPFQHMQDADTSHLFFDPLADKWLAPFEVVLDSNAWQKISLAEVADFYVKEGQPFGFTIQNITLPSQGNERMELWSKSITDFGSDNFFNPSHSLKFYTNPATDSSVGWQVKDYDWAMYVVAEIITDGPYAVYSFLDKEIPLATDTPQKISVKINLYGWSQIPYPVNEAYLKYKTEDAPYFETVKMSASQDTFSAVVPPLLPGKKLNTYVVVFDNDSNRFQSQVASYNTITAIFEPKKTPEDFRLETNYPNPFNPSTTILYSIPQAAQVRIAVYNTLGQQLRLLVDESKSAATYRISWDGRDTNNIPVPSGIYFCRMQVNGKAIATNKMTLIR